MPNLTREMIDAADDAQLVRWAHIHILKTRTVTCDYCLRGLRVPKDIITSTCPYCQQLSELRYRNNPLLSPECWWEVVQAILSRPCDAQWRFCLSTTMGLSTARFWVPSGNGQAVGESTVPVTDTGRGIVKAALYALATLEK